MSFLQFLKGKGKSSPDLPNGDFVDWEKSLIVMQKNIGYKFRDINYLKSALMHLSYVRKNGINEAVEPLFERMEFLGDSVLGMIVAETIYCKYPDKSEGSLSKLKSKIVSENYLAMKAHDIGLGQFILMSEEELRSGGQKKKSILSNTMESLTCAVYLDSNVKTVKKFIMKNILNNFENDISQDIFTNFKSKLQEYSQSIYHKPPDYINSGEEGPDHRKIFIMDVYVNNEKIGSGSGSNKKEAQQNAAKDACLNLKI